MISRSRAFVLVLSLMKASPAIAADPYAIHDRPIVSDCIQATARNRPWLEKTLWGLYDQERGWVGAEIANSNGTFDLGLLQINTSWLPIIAARLRRDAGVVHRWLRDDACFNIGVGAWIFLSVYRQNHDFWRAVGAYHSPTDWRARIYIHRVADRIADRYGKQVFQRASASGRMRAVDRRRRVPLP